MAGGGSMSDRVNRNSMEALGTEGSVIIAGLSVQGQGVQ